MKCCPNQYRPQKLLRNFRRCGDKYPRIFSIFFGIVVPLLILDVASILIGRWVSMLESPLEIVNNDAILEKTTYLDFIARLLSNITSKSPSACFSFYQSNATEEEINDILNGFLDDFVDDGAIAIENFQLDYTSQEIDAIVELNATDVLLYLQKCGDGFRQTRERILSNSSQFFSVFDSILTFQWNRCSSYYKSNLTTVSDFSQSEYEKSLRPVSPSAGTDPFQLPFYLLIRTFHVNDSVFSLNNRFTMRRYGPKTKPEFIMTFSKHTEPSRVSPVVAHES
jgi:hypothetical protein